MRHQDHPLYYVWRNLRRRCRSTRDADYAGYGGRGITYDPRWTGFEIFLADMAQLGPRPEGYSLDRIDGTQGYFIANLRWASPVTQAYNRRRRTERPGLYYLADTDTWLVSRTLPLRGRQRARFFCRGAAERYLTLLEWVQTAELDTYLQETAQ